MDDILTEPLPIATGPRWSLPSDPAPGLGVTVDEAKLARWHANHVSVGQYLPYQRHQLASEDPDWHR